MTTYKELIYWKKSVELVVLVYKFTADFPKEEIYGLISQMRRAVVSIPSNVAEGWTRKNTGEYINFLSISNGSAAELETQLIVTQELNYGKKELRDKCFSLLLEIQKMLTSSINSLRSP
ncbi:MAG: four helix bundle protein [Patescibacteria group bacterium]